MRARSKLVIACVAIVSAAIGSACDRGSSAAPPSVAADDASTPPPSSTDAALPDADAPALDDDARLTQLIAALASAATVDARAALVGSFAHDVAYGERGFPIATSSRVRFVYWDADDRGGSFFVAGDFDGWSPSATPMQRPVPSAPLYVADVALPLPGARSLYKLVRDGVFFADPWARRFGYDAYGEYSLLDAGAASHLERWPAFRDPRGALEARPIVVYTPQGYSTTASPAYPLLVMHDGQNLFDPAAPHGGWHVGDAADEAIASGAVRPFVVAAIPNSARRFDEYTHTTDTLPGIGTVGGAADAYGAWVADVVVPFVRARYRVRSEASQTAILGSSLGGLVSLYVARARPDVFGNAGSMSGTISWGSIGATNPTIADLYMQNAPTSLRLYLDSGGDDGGGCATLSKLDSETSHDQYCETRALRDALLSRGWTSGSTLFYAWAQGAQHDESAWAARLPAALRAWFPGK